MRVSDLKAKVTVGKGEVLVVKLVKHGPGLFDEDVAGSITMFVLRGDVSAYISDLYIDEKYKDSGLSYMLITAAKEAARRRGLYTISLHCATDMVDFYTKLGFEVLSRGDVVCMEADVELPYDDYLEGANARSNIRRGRKEWED